MSIDLARTNGKPRWMIAARSGAATWVTVELAALAAERPQVGAAGDGRRGREDADPARVGDRRRDLGLGLDHRRRTSTPRLGGDRARPVSRPAAAAELQAITTSFAPRSSR